MTQINITGTGTYRRGIIKMSASTADCAVHDPSRQIFGRKNSRTSLFDASFGTGFQHS